MKYLVLAMSLAAAAMAGDAPRISTAMVASAAQRLDQKMGGLASADDPVMPLGLTQGAYIGGFGVVFMGSINLAPMAGVTPFHTSISKEEYARVHQKKIDRLPKLKQAMQDMLMNLAASLDTVPSNDQIAIAISLFNFQGEDTAGIPAQIVMRAPKKSLIDMKTGNTGPGWMASAIQTDLF